MSYRTSPDGDGYYVEVAQGSEAIFVFAGRAEDRAPGALVSSSERVQLARAILAHTPHAVLEGGADALHDGWYPDEDD